MSEKFKYACALRALHPHADDEVGHGDAQQDESDDTNDD